MINKKSKQWKTVEKWFNKSTFACAWIGTFIGLVFSQWYWTKTHTISSPEPVKQTIVVKAEEYPRSYYEADVQRYIRFRGQELGYNDYDITVFVKIAEKESSYNPTAKNPNSTAKGIYQFIDGTWRHYCLNDGNVYDAVANIDCFYKVLEQDGFPKGLNHWASSKEKWNK